MVPALHDVEQLLLQVQLVPEFERLQRPGRDLRADQLDHFLRICIHFILLLFFDVSHQTSDLELQIC